MFTACHALFAKTCYFIRDVSALDCMMMRLYIDKLGRCASSHLIVTILSQMIDIDVFH